MSEIDELRREVSADLDPKQRSQMGQFMTPSSIARFMASLFPPCSLDHGRLLDAGAGIGALSLSFLQRWTEGGMVFRQMTIDAFEIDPVLRGHLSRVLADAARNLPAEIRVCADDFIESASCAFTDDLFRPALGLYTHAILNPPYKKLRSASPHRHALRRAGIETVNLYSAFVALSLRLLQAGGQLVAIIPRSFCNGPYYRSFRELVLSHAAIRHIHLFDSRTQAFRDDAVLQENVIIRLERSATQSDVILSHSADDSFAHYEERRVPFAEIVHPGDHDKFIYIPTESARGEAALFPGICHRLSDLDVEVATGPVVDFRMREHLRAMPSLGTAPLLYPGHFSAQGMQWPKLGFKKANAIACNKDTEKWLFPSGFYTVVRRFSSKEEPRRIVAGVADPTALAHAKVIGFENHLNVFHRHRMGLPEDVARGLAVFLNTSILDRFFRTFNGHTQVNATDLRSIKYPSVKVLATLGKWASKRQVLEQAMMDDHLRRLTA